VFYLPVKNALKSSLKQDELACEAKLFKIIGLFKRLVCFPIILIVFLIPRWQSI